METYPQPPENETIWRILDLRSGAVSKRWFTTENDAAIYAAAFNTPGVQGTASQADVNWIVISDSPAE